MFKKVYQLLILGLILGGCGFSPVYKDLKYDFSIEVLKDEGDRILNNYIKNNLNKYNQKNANSILISFKTEFNKNPISKDISGKTTEYELSATVKFTANINNSTKEFYFQETTKMTAMSNIVDENDFQKNTLFNFSSSFVEKLVLEIINAN